MLVDAFGALSVTAWNCLRKPECTLAPGYSASKAGDSGALFSLQASHCHACLRRCRRQHCLRARDIQYLQLVTL